MGPLRGTNLAQQIQQWLLEHIEKGIYQPGEQLPAETELALQLGISRATLREALLNLERQGIVVRKHGIGTFITSGYNQRVESGLEQLVSTIEMANKQGLEITFSRLQVRQEPAEAEEAELLGLASGSSLTIIERAILVDEQVVAYMVDAVPASVLSAADISETFNGSVLDLLKQKHPRQVAWARANLVALNADAFLSKQLDIKRGQAILLIKQVSFDDQGLAMDLSRGYFIPQFFSFHVVRR